MGASRVFGSTGPGEAPYARAACWEDPATWEVLDLSPGHSVIVAETSGDAALGLAARGYVVTAALPEPGARARVALAGVAARMLPIQSVRSLFGLAHFGRRVWFYHFVREHLPSFARVFWDAREHVVRAGLADSGALELAGMSARRVLSRASSGPRLWVGARLVGPALARRAGLRVEGAGERLHTRLLAGGPYSDWLLGRAGAELPRPWIAADGLPILAKNPPVVVAEGLAEVLAGAPSASVRGVLLGGAPVGPDVVAPLLRALAPGGRVLGWGPTPAGLAVDARATARARAADRSVLPGEPWVAVR